MIINGDLDYHYCDYDIYPNVSFDRDTNITVTSRFAMSFNGSVDYAEIFTTITV